MPHSEAQADELIRRNAEAHDRVVNDYDGCHVEIFNPVEQSRLAAGLEAALQAVHSESQPRHALDFGTGTGNLTRHLLDLGATVTATDVSSGCLQAVEARFGGTGRLRTSLLNGKNLSQFPDAVFDLVATYSVLHHVPDYLAAVDELFRVVKPGGVVVIDHEAAPQRWQRNPEYEQYLKDLGGDHYRTYCVVQGVAHTEPFARKWRRRAGRVFSLHAWRVYLRRRHGDGRFIGDHGDIHVFPDDHIEWEQIEQRAAGRFETLGTDDYLVCREWDPTAPVWNRYKDRCCDTRALILRRLR